MRGRTMKKRLCAVLCAATVFLTGCGAIELTDSESDLIAEYAATVLLKYSVTYQPKLQEEVVEIETTQDIYTIPTSANVSNTPNTGQNTPSNPSTEAPSKTLSEALGVAAEGFQVEYAGYELAKIYPDTEDTYFAMRATGNHQLLVMKFHITNHSGAEKECDILSKERSYRCLVNDTERFGAQLTMLLDDLASFKEVFSAGETKQAVLIFQVPSEYEGTITSLNLSVKGEGETNSYLCEQGEKESE